MHRHTGQCGGPSDWGGNCEANLCPRGNVAQSGTWFLHLYLRVTYYSGSWLQTYSCHINSRPGVAGFWSSVQQGLFRLTCFWPIKEICFQFTTTIDKEQRDDHRQERNCWTEKFQEMTGLSVVGQLTNRNSETCVCQILQRSTRFLWRCLCPDKLSMPET